MPAKHVSLSTGQLLFRDIAQCGMARDNEGNLVALLLLKNGETRVFTGDDAVRLSKFYPAPMASPPITAPLNPLTVTVGEEYETFLVDEEPGDVEGEKPEDARVTDD